MNWDQSWSSRFASRCMIFYLINLFWFLNFQSSCLWFLIFDLTLLCCELGGILFILFYQNILRLEVYFFMFRCFDLWFFCASASKGCDPKIVCYSVLSLKMDLNSLRLDLLTILVLYKCKRMTFVKVKLAWLYQKK